MLQFHFNLILLFVTSFVARTSCITFYKGDPGELNDLESIDKKFGKTRTKRNLLSFPASTTITFQNKLDIPVFSKLNGNITGKFSGRIYVRYTFPLDVTIGRSNPAIDRERSLSYSTIASMFDSFGLNGTDCLLRSICESAYEPVKGYGILDDFLHMFLSPNHNINLERTTMNQYIHAEFHGRNNGTCYEKYSGCSIPLGELIHAGITSMMEASSQSQGRFSERQEL